MLLEQPIIIKLCGDWTSATVDVIMLIVTVSSVLCAFFAYAHQKARNKKDAACSLAKHYAESVINKYADLINIYNMIGISADVKRLVDIAEINNFDTAEMNELTKGKENARDNLFEKIDYIDPAIILEVRMRRCRSATERNAMFDLYKPTEEDKEKTIANWDSLQVEFREEIFELLNELEWFAMNCRYRLADEELLYQSLHKTFLSTVWLLYFHISRHNEKNEDKLYTNVIWLFVKWRDRLHEITKKTEKRRQRYLKKAGSIRTPVYSGKPL